MSITDELREWAKEHLSRSSILAIADRIDAEHERLMEERADRYSELRAKMNNCYIELPKDAYGVPVRVGDELCNYTLSGYPYPNGGVYCKAIVNERMVLVGQKDSSFKDLLMWEARWCHHHHALTVEDVLRDVVTLCHNTWKEGSAFEFYDVDDVMKSGNIAEFAAKLRLAEGEDA